MPLSYVTITGSFLDGSDQPLQGVATFTPNTTVYASGIPVLQADVPVQAVVTAGQLLDAAGQPLKLLATDNAGLSYIGQTGFVFWTVALTLGGVAEDPWSFFLPSSPASRDLFSLANTPAGGAPVTSVFGRTGAVAAQSGDYTATQVGADASGAAAAAQAAAQAASVAKAGDTMGGHLAPKVAALSQSAGSVAVDASQGNVFSLALTASGWTIANPSNPVDGQAIRIRLAQDATGGRTVNWGTAYDFGTSGAPVLTTTASKTDIAAFEYVAALAKWCFLGSGLGF